MNQEPETRKRIIEEALTEWQKHWDQFEKERQMKSYLPRVGSIEKIVNRYALSFVTDHGPFNAKLFALGFKDTETFDCGEEQTAKHVLWDYPLVEEYQDHALATFRKRENLFFFRQATINRRRSKESRRICKEIDFNYSWKRPASTKLGLVTHRSSIWWG